MIGTSENSWTRQGATGILTLTGEKGNYLVEPEFMPYHLLEKWFNEPDLKAIIIRGSGRHFSAGANLGNLKQFARDEGALRSKIARGKELIGLIENIALPVVAEISGVCFGGGLEIALACSIRICGENALFAFPEVNHGIMPGLGGTINLSRVIGPGKAAEVLLSGDVVPSDRALEMRIVDYRVPDRNLHDFTLKYVEKLTSGRDVEVIRSIMRSIHNSQSMDFASAMALETSLFCALAVRSMQEK